MTIIMAFRNLWRRKRRTVVTALSVSFGMWLAILAVGIREDTYSRLIETSTKMGFGHMSLVSKEFLEGHRGRGRIVASPSLIRNIMADENIVFTIPRMMGEAVVATAKKSTGAGYLAIDPALDTGEYNIFTEHITVGQPLSARPKDGCLVGQTLARRFDLKIGSQLIYTTTDASGQVGSWMARVVGVFSVGNEEVDGHLVVLPLQTLRQQLGYSEDEATFLAIYGKKNLDVESVYEKLKVRWHSQDSDIIPWYVSQPDLASYIRIDKVIYRLLIFFIGIIVAAGVFSTMIMNIVERRRELGTMLALGLSPLSLFL